MGFPTAFLPEHGKRRRLVQRDQIGRSRYRITGAKLFESSKMMGDEGLEPPTSRM